MIKLPPHLQARWRHLAPREKTGLRLATGLVSLAVLWWVLLAPALQIWRNSEAQHRHLDAQLQTMQDLQAQAQTLQSQPRLGFDDARRALDASVKQQLGTAAQFNVSGESAAVTLKEVSPEALAAWLTQARINAHALPSEVRLTRSASANPGWDGTVVLALPAR